MVWSRARSLRLPYLLQLHLMGLFHLLHGAEMLFLELAEFLLPIPLTHHQFSLQLLFLFNFLQHSSKVAAVWATKSDMLLKLCTSVLS